MRDQRYRIQDPAFHPTPMFSDRCSPLTSQCSMLNAQRSMVNAQRWLPKSTYKNKDIIMKISFIILLAFCFFGATTKAGDIHKEIKVSPGKALQMDLDTGGDITITGWEKEAVGNVNGHSMGGAVTYRNVSDRAGSTSGEVERITSMG